jgi:hypothetical protein
MRVLYHDGELALRDDYPDPQLAPGEVSCAYVSPVYAAPISN